jgi:predicted CXXCH cytochrome family protein
MTKIKRPSARMQTCSECKKTYVSKHRCKAGTCVHCRTMLRNLGKHKCPIMKIAAVSPIEMYKAIIISDGKTCSGCHTTHFSTRNNRGLWHYKGIDLCSDCYNIPQIQGTISQMWLALAAKDVEMEKSKCTVCEKRLIDPETGSVIADFRRPYVDIFSEEPTVWALIHSGSSVHSIMEASSKSRNLCVACHSAQVAAKRHIGNGRLPRLVTQTSPSDMKEMACQKVESLVRLLRSPPGGHKAV